MYQILENAQASTDTDFQNHNLLNVNALNPLPTGICSSTDSRLSDSRNPLPGSVVDASVSATAAIQQSKLALNAGIPIAWLGNTNLTAAQGNLAEYVANKGVANGYASLDATGKVPLAQIPSIAGTGTVTSVALKASTLFTVAGSPITTTGQFDLEWAAAPALTWFGNPNTTTALTPTFNATPIPVGLIPNLDMSHITSGILPPAQGGMLSGGAAGQYLAKIDGTNFNIQWTTPPGAPVASVFGRLGAVVAQANDYTFPQVSAGTGTNDNAAPGNVGEFISVSKSTANVVAVPSATYTTILSISLTPGDWDVRGDFIWGANNYTANTASTAVVGIGSTAGTIADDGYQGYGYQLAGSSVYTGYQTVSMPPRRFSLAAATTLYMIARIVFTGAGSVGGGFLEARRVR